LSPSNGGKTRSRSEEKALNELHEFVSKFFGACIQAPVRT
jgi:hypothetical protein